MSTAPVTPAPVAAPTAAVPTWHLHIFYLVIIVALIFGGRMWVQERDLRMAQETTVAVLQNHVQTLEAQINQRDEQAAKQQQVIVKVIHDVQTVPQAVAAVPQVVTTPLPVPVTSDASGDMIIPKDDVIQVFDQLADDKLCNSKLSTAAADLVDEKNINANLTQQIAVLKKKPKFIKRVLRDAKLIGIGAGLGAIGLLILVH
jgi:hypothetical protein